MVEFPAEKLRARLLALTNNQEKIQTLSLWMMHHRRAYAVAVAVWQDVYRGAEDSLRQSLLYVANDLVQNCKQKNNTAYPLAFFACLPSCLALLTRYDAGKNRRGEIGRRGDMGKKIGGGREER